MSPWPLLLLPLAPALGFSWAVGHAREWIPLLLLLYYSLPVALYGLGRGLGGSAGRLPGTALPRPGEGGARLLVLLLPYALYWPAAGLLRVPLPTAYRAFLQGPGLAVPLVVLVAWPLGLHLHPSLASLSTLGLFLLAERGARRLWGA